MDKREFIKFVSKESGIPQKQIKECFDPMVACLEKILIGGDKLCIQNVGTIFTRELPERVFKNLHTKENATVPQRKVVKFKTSKTLTDKINNR